MLWSPSGFPPAAIGRSFSAVASSAGFSSCSADVQISVPRCSCITSMRPFSHSCPRRAIAGAITASPSSSMAITRRVGAVNHGARPGDVACPQRVEQALRQLLRFQFLGAGCEIQPTQVQAREVPLVDDSKHVGARDLAMAAGSLVRRQHARIDPTLDGCHTHAEHRDTSAGL